MDPPWETESPNPTPNAKTTGHLRVILGPYAWWLTASRIQQTQGAHSHAPHETRKTRVFFFYFPPLFVL